MVGAAISANLQVLANSTFKHYNRWCFGCSVWSEHFAFKVAHGRSNLFYRTRTSHGGKRNKYYYRCYYNWSLGLGGCWGLNYLS